MLSVKHKTMPKTTKKEKGKKGKKLVGNQYKLDKNHNGRLDKQDFKIMQKMRKGKGKGKGKGKKK